MNNRFYYVVGILGTLLLSSCGGNVDPMTGWKYDDPQYGGFEAVTGQEQETPPNMVFVPGGTFTMGGVEQDMTFEGSSLPRMATVQSFYMDETECTNINYLFYLNWIKKIHGLTTPALYYENLPDTFCWRDPLAYNEPMVRYYFRHPSFQQYPVVGVSWVQASDYSAWRTDRVNEAALIDAGIIEPNFEDQIDEINFNTEAYLVGQYAPTVKHSKKTSAGADRLVSVEDGIFQPDVRLPTEAEWEYAAFANEGNGVPGDENINTKRVYTLNGLGLRQTMGPGRGKMYANYQRTRGDYMGLSITPNDAADIPAPVDMYVPNDFGLYNMAGNVSEWVLDVYRPLSHEDVSDLNPYRGNEFQVLERNADGSPADKDSLGRMKYRDVTIMENLIRRNYKIADNRGSRDEMNYNGGLQKYESNSQQGFWYGNIPDSLKSNDSLMDQLFVGTSLINDIARVYKGGSWNDRAFYLSPGARKFLDQNLSSNMIGFRCAVSRVGGSPGLDANGKIVNGKRKD